MRMRRPRSFCATSRISGGSMLMEARRGDSGAMAPRPPKLSTGAESRAGAPIGSTMPPPYPQLWLEFFVNNPPDFVSFPKENTRCGEDVIRNVSRILNLDLKRDGYGKNF